MGFFFLSTVISGIVLIAKRGRLSRLGELPFRGVSYVPLAFIGVVVITMFMANDPQRWQPGFWYTVSFAAISVFVLINRALPGMSWVALGTLLNFAAIAANGGTMPASEWAHRIAGLKDVPGVWYNSMVIPDPQLLFLGDVIPIPKELPFLANNFSVGDALIVIGIVTLVYKACCVPQEKAQTEPIEFQEAA